MAPFINDRFLLDSGTAFTLFEKYAKDLPIVDYHCHINPKDIAENRHFTDLAELWLSGDHYKWRLMRAAGIAEEYITGDAPSRDKFLCWAKTIGRAVASPLYHWNCLELKRYFGIDEPLSERNAEEIWDKTCAMIKDDPDKYSARGLIGSSGVEVICTTDDPCDDLRWHRMIKEDPSFKTTVLPSFRPDPILDIEKDSYLSYISRLSEVSGIKIESLNDLISSLDQRIAYFRDLGCRIADHGMEKILFEKADEEEVANIFKKRKSSTLTSSEEAKYKTFILLHCAKRYHESGFAMQLHFGCIRDVNEKMRSSLGPNCGCDSIAGSTDLVTPLSRILSELTEQGTLPKTILYSLDPNNNAVIDTLCGCFRNVVHGAAWWFNDNLNGMKDHLKSLSCQGYLPAFTGMLTDSRSFLSYTRHEYFRRILCSFIGEQIDKGLFPNDEEIPGSVIKDICYNNPSALFK